MTNLPWSPKPESTSSCDAMSIRASHAGREEKERLAELPQAGHWSLKVTDSESLSRKQPHSDAVATHRNEMRPFGDVAGGAREAGSGTEQRSAE